MANTLPPPPQPSPTKHDGGFNDPVWHRWFAYVRELFDSIMKSLAGAEYTANKDKPNGYAGLGSLYQIHFVNQAGTFTSLMTNTNTAVRTYTFPDRTDTVVLQRDNVTFGTLTTIGNVNVTGTVTVSSTISTSGDLNAGGNSSISGTLGVGGVVNVTGDINGNSQIAVAGACGFNGATAQTPVALPADATDLASVITLANALKASAISFGFNS